jgi:hypothetical protein
MKALRYEEHIGLIHLQAKKGFKWAHGAGSGLEYEDMFQVASAAFCIAAEGFNPDSGHKFSTYYTQVAFSEFRKEIGIMTGVKNLNDGQREEIAARKEENKSRRAAGLPELPEMNYGLAPVSFGAMTAPGEDGELATPFEATLADESMSPEEQLERRQIWDQATANLSPLARLIVDWLRDPPDELMREIEAQRVYADRCTAAGKRAHGLRDGLTIAAVCKFLELIGDVKRRELLLAEKELMDVVKAIDKEDAK